MLGVAFRNVCKPACLHFQANPPCVYSWFTLKSNQRVLSWCVARSWAPGRQIVNPIREIWQQYHFGKSQLLVLSLAADKRHPGMTVAPNNPREEPNRYSPCQFSQNLRMSDPITIISEMIPRIVNTTLRTAAEAAVIWLEDSWKVQKEKPCHPERNLISTLLLTRREVTDNRLRVGVCILLILYFVHQHLVRSVQGFTLVNLYWLLLRVWSQWTHWANVPHAAFYWN